MRRPTWLVLGVVALAAAAWVFADFGTSPVGMPTVLRDRGTRAA